MWKCHKDIHFIAYKFKYIIKMSTQQNNAQNKINKWFKNYYENSKLDKT